MQRRNSVSSQPPNLPRADSARDIRDVHTDSLLAIDQRFIKKSRKSDPQLAATARSYCFPNGEVFTPRNAPAKRNKPAKLLVPESRQSILRTGLMVLVLLMNLNHLANHLIHSAAPLIHSTAPLMHSTAPLMHSAAHSVAHSMHSNYSVPYITQLPLFNNMKLKHKQDLVLLIRNTKVDTPTNINISFLTPQQQQQQQQQTSQPFQPRLFSLTNNRYMENSTNIVRLEQLFRNTSSETFVNGKPCGSDLNPLSLSNYNLNRSNSNTPQTLVSTSDNDGLHPDDCGSSSSLQKSHSLVSIQESSAAEKTAHEQKEIELSTAAGSPSVETVGLDLDQLEMGVSPRIPQSVSTHSPSSLDMSAYDSANEYASLDSVEKNDRQEKGGESKEKEETGEIGKSTENDKGANSIKASDSELPNLAGIKLSTPVSLVEVPTEISRTETVLQELKQTDSSPIPLPELTQSGSSLSVIGQTGEDNYESQNQVQSDDSSEGFHDTTEDSQRFSRDVSHETIDTTQSFDVTTDLATLSSGKLELMSIANSTSNDLPEPTIILEPASKLIMSANGNAHLPTDNNKVAGPTSAGRNLSLEERPTIVRARSLSRQASMRNTPSPVPQTLLQRVSSMLFAQEPKQESQENQQTQEKEERQEKLETDTQTEKNIQYRPVKSLLDPVQPEDIKQVNHEFLKRKNIELKLEISNDENATITEMLSEAPTPVSKDSVKRAKTSPDYSELVTPTNLTHKSRSVTPKDVTPQSVFSFKPGEETLLRKASGSGSVVNVSALYSQGQIEKFLTDDQKEVPPRGDLDIKGSLIKVHKRQTSLISSMNSILKGLSPKEELTTSEMKQPPKMPEQTLQLQNRLSMLNVVDVDFDKSLPPTPERKHKYTGRFSLLGDPLASPIKAPLPQRIAPKDSPIKERFSMEESISSDNVKKSGSMANFKKVFGLFGSDSKKKQKERPKLVNKNSMTSLRSMRASNKSPEPSQAKRLMLDQPRPSYSLEELTTSKPLKSLNKRKKFIINLKLASANRIEELPSPVYSVRERSQTPDVPPLERQPSQKFDLPQFEVENDTFDDLLLKFDEVEKEAEMEVEQQLSSPKLLSGLFLKDDELTKAQIADQQKNDNQLSDESLPRKFPICESPRNEEEEPISEQSFDASNIYWPTEEEALSRMKSDELVMELPSRPGEQRILFTKEGLCGLLAENGGPSYLKHIKQFADFEQLEIKVKDFDPTSQEEVRKPESQVNPILKDGLKKSSGRSVKFSSTISISETFPPHMYKRYNKSVTQYYLTEFAEVNRIKNELNAYKCHEMLVHEKSQMNTHFFY